MAEGGAITLASVDILLSTTVLGHVGNTRAPLLPSDSNASLARRGDANIIPADRSAVLSSLFMLESVD